MGQDYPQDKIMVFYDNISVTGIFYSIKTRDNPANLAFAWVEAENIFAVRALVCRWFDMLENGSAQDVELDTTRPFVPQEKADWLIEQLDADFEMESSTRGHILGVDTGPEFHRLNPAARLAFAQQYFQTVKTEERLEAEVKRRTETGERLPPSEALYTPQEEIPWAYSVDECQG